VTAKVDIRMRLQSYLSRAGIASRRQTAELIKEGKVSVNGVVTREPGKSVDPDEDKITYLNRLVSIEKKAYYLFHKPMNVITTTKDTHDRKTVAHYFKKLPVRVYPVGRLDRNTTGLLLLTNDGDLANRLMHPRHGIQKRYVVLTKSPLSKAQILKFRKGVRLGSEKTAPCEIVYHGRAGSGHAYEVTLREGKNRQIRRMMEILDKSVTSLHRYEYGSIHLGKLKAGESRPLTAQEVQLLKLLSSGASD